MTADTKMGRGRSVCPVSICRTRCSLRHFLGLLFLCMLLLLNACGTTQRFSSEEHLTVLQVPFFPQETFQCGPAALATVINYWYEKTGAEKILRPETIAADIYSSSARGVLGIDLELYARKQGFRTRQLAGTVDQLKVSLDEGTPPIVLVDYGFSSYQRNHFMVVKGYSDRAILVNSGREESKLTAIEDLLKVWKKAGYWMLIVKP
jgi:ABC-type bacteriocin/lantibiotic exporter with double-glycine peptidase domain